jgi:ATP-binding cassette subfamily C (CFTR/MRP) protein 1
MPLMLVVIFAVGITLAIVAKKYLRTSVELQRIQLVSISPILSTSTEAVNGLVALRGSGKTAYFYNRWVTKCDTNTKCMMNDACAEGWMITILEFSVAILISGVVFCIAMTPVINLNTVDNVTMMGFILANTLGIAASMPALLESLGGLIKSSASIERLHEYVSCEKLEKPFEEPKAPEGWPAAGKVSVENINVRYRDGLPLVLKSLTFEVLPKEKIGVVGRTGCGKSTMLLALTRILELAEKGDKPEDGSAKEIQGKTGIFIDGVDVGQMGLHYLRQNMTVIPQDPSIFDGTIKYNVDPMEEHSDDAIVDALVKSQVWDTLDVRNLKGEENHTDARVEEEPADGKQT